MWLVACRGTVLRCWCLALNGGQAGYTVLDARRGRVGGMGQGSVEQLG